MRGLSCALFLLSSLLANASAREPEQLDDLRPLLLAQRQTNEAVHESPELVPAPTKVPDELRKPEKAPWMVRWLVHPRPAGMFLNLPVIAADPNRGITVGVLPIWVIPNKVTGRIEQIHAPSFTYNKTFSFIPSYRYYYYPSPVESLVVRGSASVLAEHEALLMYQNRRLFDTLYDFYFRGEYSVDGSNRFYGFGPATPKSGESVYTEDNIGYDVALGHPIGTSDHHWRTRFSDHFMGEKFYAGKIPNLPSITDAHPGLVAVHRQEDNEVRAAVEYDTRDSMVTTSKGAYLNAFAGKSLTGFASAFDYERYGFDGRYIHPWPGDVKTATAAQFKFEQVLGQAPFWLQSHLGGKYSIRAYGDDRFTDRGVMFAQIEQRIIFYQKKLSGVTTDFEVAPFAGVGEVFDNPTVAQARYARPVVGTAVRAIARPQVVGSLDFGIGQEGVAIFMDINYSF